MHEWMHCCDEAANHQLPIAAAFWIFWIVFVEECSSLSQNLMHICCSTHSVLLNAMGTQYPCLLNGVCLPPLLTNTVKLSLFTHAHSSPLSWATRLYGCCANHFWYINNGLTFSRHIFIHKHTHTYRCICVWFLETKIRSHQWHCIFTLHYSVNILPCQVIYVWVIILNGCRFPWNEHTVICLNQHFSKYILHNGNPIKWPSKKRT